MKLHIMYKFKEGSWGGANQFLKALKDEFKKKGRYTEHSEEADVLLFNSYPFGSEFFFDHIFYLKKKYPKKIIIHRLTGPIAMYRKDDKAVDRVIKLFNDAFVDGTVFQSTWCMEQCRKGRIVSPYQTVIFNAPDKNIFNKKNKMIFSRNKKVKLIASSWSPNWGKGFNIFQYLDTHLDFSSYDMTFVGNSPVCFKNINHIPPVSSKDLVSLLKKHNLFIFGSRIESCSNSLIEALSCGLPAVALNTSSNPEVVGRGGELFEGTNDVIEKIEKVTNAYQVYQSRIPEFNIQKIAESYYHFARNIYDHVNTTRYKPKKILPSTIISFCKMKTYMATWKLLKKAKTLF